jgi:hypothetical protein
MQKINSVFTEYCRSLNQELSIYKKDLEDKCFLEYIVLVYKLDPRYRREGAL